MGISVYYVPRLTNYDHALRMYEQVTPIRGTDRKPLGRRRDHNTYSIRKRADGAIELVCYTTPVVTLEPPVEGAPDSPQIFKLQTNGWMSVATRQFIQQTLGIRVSAQGSYIVLHFGGKKHAFRGKEIMTLALDGEGWRVLNPVERTSYRINRKAANNVRARYAQFAKYLNGIVSLRREILPGMTLSYNSIPAKEVVYLSCEELKEVFGLEEYSAQQYAYVLPARGTFTPYMPAALTRTAIPMEGGESLLQRSHKLYQQRAPELVRMMTSGDAQEMYKAFVWLAVPDYGRRIKYVEDSAMAVQEKTILANFREFILRWHADEVIESFQTPVGEMPAEKYRSWVAA